jgi:hypothetical protein
MGAANERGGRTAGSLGRHGTEVEKVRGAGSKDVGTRQSRYVGGGGGRKATTATERRMVGTGRNAQASAGSTTETLKASGRWQRARGMQSRKRAEAVELGELGAAQRRRGNAHWQISRSHLMDWMRR